MSNGRPSSKDTIENIIGSSPTMQHVFMLTRRAAGCSSNILLQGETGTGKRLLAQTIHRLSGNLDSFRQINCAAFDDRALEESLFGSSERPGLIQQSSGETLFLDEINSVSMRLQVKLLECIEDRMKQQSETDFEHRNALRLITSTNCELAKEVADGRFREDLFWRLNVLPIALPPLRRRKEDVEELVRHFLGLLSSEAKTVDKIHPDSLAALKSYQWPGNLRELQNYIERAFVLADSQELTPDLLPTSVMGDRQAAEEAVFRPTDEKSLVHEFVYNRLRKAPENEGGLHKQIVEPIEKELLVQILDMCKNVQKKAADRLGINRNTLYKKMKEYGLEKSNSKALPDDDDDNK